MTSARAVANMEQPIEGGGPSVGPGPLAEPPPGAWGSPLERSSWAALLRRVFALDVFQWPAAGGQRGKVGGSERALEFLRSYAAGGNQRLGILAVGALFAIGILVLS